MTRRDLRAYLILAAAMLVILTAGPVPRDDL
jgi:hypothetical protein